MKGFLADFKNIKVEEGEMEYYPRSLPPWDEKGIQNFIIEAETKRDFLWNLFRITRNMKIDICSINYFRVKAKTPYVYAMLSLDFSRSDVKPEETLEIINRELNARKAHLIKADEDMFIRNCFFPSIADYKREDERAIIFSRRIYEALFKGMRRKFGSAGKAILYYEGFQIGYETCENYVSIEHLIKHIKFLHMKMGWAIIRDIKANLERKRANIRVSKNFECELGKGSNEPYSYFYRGILAGFFAKIFRKEVQAEETKCIAKGDPYCEFEIKAII